MTRSLESMEVLMPKVETYVKVAIESSLIERVKTAMKMEFHHCRATTGRLAGFCEPDECSCPCNGCCPPGALSEAKRALADAVMEYVIKHA